MILKADLNWVSKVFGKINFEERRLKAVMEIIDEHWEFSLMEMESQIIKKGKNKFGKFQGSTAFSLLVLQSSWI